MPDPLDRLRLPSDPIAPDPAFAAQLRTRIARALERPKGATMSGLALENIPTPGSGQAVLTPYLAVSGAWDALNWYARAFGLA